MKLNVVATTWLRGHWGLFFCENTKHDKLLNKHKTDVLAPVAWPNVPFFWLISTILRMSTAMEAAELATARKLHHLYMVFWFGFQNTDNSGGGNNPFRKKEWEGKQEA